MCTSQNKTKKGTNNADIHNQEHERWNRRSFLQALGFAGGGSMLLANTNITASVPSKLTQAISEANTDRILVLVRLKGGNDGLNTIVPIYDFDTYARARPTLHHKENKLYKLSDDFGIPEAMKNLQSMWGEGAMKVVHGVGYENQDLSHFKSSNIWASTDLDEIENSGFMGRYFEGLYPDFLINPPEVPAAIQIGSIGNLIFDGQGISNYALTVSNPEELKRLGETGTKHSLTDLPDCTYGTRLSYLRSVTNNTFTYAKTIFEAYNKATNTVEYSEKGFGKQLSIISRMIKGGLGTKVYMVSLGGFDTHANQAEKHTELWEEVAKNMTLFYEDLNKSGMDKQVLSMSISEFGRRVEENGSKGTDHGQAAPVMLFGPALEGNGFVGEHPDLADLDRVGNLKYKTDFREVYSTVMKEWLCIDAATVDEALLGQKINTRDLGFLCKSSDVNGSDGEADVVGNEGVVAVDNGVIDVSNGITKTKVKAYQENGETIISIAKPDTTHVNVTLFSLTGQRVAEVKNEMLPPGKHPINLSKEIDGNLNQGIYIYRVLSGDKAFSKKIFL